MKTKVVNRFSLFLAFPCRISLVWVLYGMCIAGFLMGLPFTEPPFSGHDQKVQYVQSLSGEYGDWHPPVLSATWRFLRLAGYHITGREIVGDYPNFILQNGILWAGILLVLISGKKFWQYDPRKPKSWLARVFAVFALGWLLFGDVFQASLLVSKDVELLGCYMVATGCLLNWPKKRWKKRCACICVVLALFYGTAVRHNAVFSLLPLLFWLAWLILPTSEKKGYFVVVYGVVGWTVMLMTIHWVNYSFLKARHLYPLQERFYEDIFLLNAHTNQFILPPDSFGNDFSGLSEALFREKFNRYTIYLDSAFTEINKELQSHLVFTQNHVVLAPPEAYEKTGEKKVYFPGFRKNDWGFEMVVLDPDVVEKKFPEDYAKLREAWIKRIKSQPIDYIKVKTRIFWDYIKNFKLNFFRFNGAIILFLNVWTLALFTFSKDVFNKRVFPQLMLAWSGFLYISPLLIFLTDNQVYRYLYWFAAAALISFFLICSQSKLIHSIFGMIFQYYEERLKAFAAR